MQASGRQGAPDWGELGSNEQAAQQFDLAPEAGRLAYQRLHQRHALFQDPGTGNVRMAHPLSAVPTPFGVASQGRRYWANCAWMI